MMIIFKLHGNDALEHLSLSQHNKDFWAASTKLDQAEKKKGKRKDSQKKIEILC